jgi:hypothetical protein
VPAGFKSPFVYGSCDSPISKLRHCAHRRWCCAHIANKEPTEMQNRETFIMDDSRSTRKLTRNTKGEENSAHAYRIFMLKQLR